MKDPIAAESAGAVWIERRADEDPSTRHAQNPGKEVTCKLSSTQEAENSAHEGS